ncbi:alpha/beta hydrolase [Sphingomonas sp. G-3-2-10]|uniref:alpha/beta fold hydrolase n=1 Tax=Sphingomonas sp. G-3-2-10 TaxID=2728838 RepID=UPI00146E11D2|nr:alpha/beta hydrolase [Sphingomonas sp. G-3-2-10]NML08419.1 alpha/beta hydrolase [Sphingomonas sp. G-3-2-10]
MSDTPDWFADALAQAPERSFIDVEGAAIELLAWGERGKPGLMLLHGSGAHASWWRFIAPFFAADYRVAAISWSGMGNSGWREEYSIEQMSREALAGARAAGLYDHADLPVYVAHSFGGAPLLRLAIDHPEAMRAVVIVDTAAEPDLGAIEALEKPFREQHRPYDDQGEAKQRFRFLPDDEYAPAYIRRFIGDESLRFDEATERWIWKFDRQHWKPGDLRTKPWALVPQLRVPASFIYGEHTSLFSPESIDRIRDASGERPPIEIVKGAGHHVMIDQPLAFVEALRGLLP